MYGAGLYVVGQTISDDASGEQLIDAFDEEPEGPFCFRGHFYWKASKTWPDSLVRKQGQAWMKHLYTDFFKKYEVVYTRDRVYLETIRGLAPDMIVPISREKHMLLADKPNKLQYILYFLKFYAQQYGVPFREKSILGRLRGFREPSDALLSSDSIYQLISPLPGPVYGGTTKPKNRSLFGHKLSPGRIVKNGPNLS